MIRLTALWLLVSFLAVYAWKDWFRSLCGLIVLIAVVEHPDFPKGVFGIQGLNPWNILMLAVVLAWTRARRDENLTWDLPPRYTMLFLAFFMVIIVSFARMVTDMNGVNEWMAFRNMAPPSTGSLVSEGIINRFKWFVPAVLIFDGCRSKERLKIAVLALVVLYVALAIQIVRWMPFSTIVSGGDLSERSLKILINEVGFHRVNLAMMMAGAFWAVVSTISFWNTKWAQNLARFCAALILLALAMTGGRTGYATWAVIGVVVAFIKWRRFVILGPLILALLVTLVPGASERFQQGFGTSPEGGLRDTRGYQSESADLYTVTSGRNIAWPLVIEKIGEAPVVGHGTNAMVREGLTLELYANYRESFPHPHSAYLEWMLDNGLVGSVFVLVLFYLLVRNATSVFRADEGYGFATVGGVAFSLLLAFLVAGLGSQTFYPREGSVGMWVSVALLLRAIVIVQSRQAATQSKRTQLSAAHCVPRETT